MNKAAAPLVMSAGQRESLMVLAQSSTAPHREVQRAKVLLMAGQGVANSRIAVSVGVTPVTVRSWRARFCATHKHKNVQVWLAKHPRFHLHFTPTSSSWLNLVERWFRELTDKAIRRGVFHSVAKVHRGRVALEQTG